MAKLSVEQIKKELNRYEFEQQTIVGNTYIVPCIISNYDNDWMPVLPNLHRDANFSKHAQKCHFHYDLRFFDPMTFFEKSGVSGDQLENGGRAALVVVASEVVKFSFRPTMCYRTFTGVEKVPLASFGENILRFYASSVGKTFENGICPHWKVPMLLRKDGLFECPNHGLIGCPKTGKIISNAHFEGEQQRSPLLSDILINGILEKYG